MVRFFIESSLDIGDNYVLLIGVAVYSIPMIGTRITNKTLLKIKLTIKGIVMSIETFEELETAIKKENILKKYKLEKIGIFGSFARGEIANDIDFYIDEGCDLKNLNELKKDLEKISQKSVDIMTKKYANPIVLHRAKKDMKYVN
jgi:predicted nucleotidyltransferase